MAVGAAAVSMAVAEAVSMGVESEASMGAVDPVVVGRVGVAASEAASDLLAEEVTRAAAGLNLAAISVRREIVRRIFLPPSTMANGIHSATPAVPHGPVAGVLRVPVKDATPEAWRTQASPLAIRALPMALGTRLADQARAQQEARPV